MAWRPAPVFETAERRDRDGAFSRIVSLFEHAGTHLDAPAHFIRGAPIVDQIPAEHVICPLAAVDIAAKAAADRAYRLSVSDLEHDKVLHGPIRPVSAAVRTGWSQHRSDEALYLGRDRDGLLHFPGVDASFEVHAKVTRPGGVWRLEGLAKLELLLAWGAIILVGAIPLAGGSGSPARLLAVIPAGWA